MSIIESFPFFSIVLPMVISVISSALKGKMAKWVNTFVITLVTIMSAILLFYVVGTNQSFVYKMGEFAAPFGNEIRGGILEAGMSLFFCIIMLLSLVGGRKYLENEVEHAKLNLYYILIGLLLSSLLALVYTNDLFNAYVFIEINTIAACGIIMIRQNGKTIEASMRYIIMSSVGSGLILIGISIIYGTTGNLAMSSIKTQVTQIMETGTYSIPLMVSVALIFVGLAIKCALYPFHSWLPDAYGYSTIASAAILSSLVSKGYIFLLIKIFYRVIGFDIISQSKIVNILFVFGLCGMIMGSLSAIKENDIRRMISYSSVAQIGYIFMGFGLGTTAGMVASIFHIISHSVTKSLLFVSAMGLIEVSGSSRHFKELTGSGYRNKIAGIVFTIGSLSMVGIPTFCGFISKLLFAEAAVSSVDKMLPTLIVLAISTILNAIYFMKTVIRIYTPATTEFTTVSFNKNIYYSISLILFGALNILVGLCSQPVVDLIYKGIDMFA